MRSIGSQFAWPIFRFFVWLEEARNRLTETFRTPRNRVRSLLPLKTNHSYLWCNNKYFSRLSQLALSVRFAALRCVVL